MSDWGIQHRGYLPVATSYTSPVAGAANVLGAWSQVTASAPRNIDLLSVSVIGKDTSGNFIFDIGMGAAGSEVVLINGIYGYTVAISCAPNFELPIPTIPAGTRIATRVQAATGAVAYDIAMSLWSNSQSSPVNRQPWVAGLSRSGASSATTIGVGTGYVEVVASTPYDSEGAIFSLWATVTSTGGEGSVIDFAIGAAGSEVIIETHYVMPRSTSEAVAFYPMFMSIPAGSRLSVRNTSWFGTAHAYYASVIGY